MCGGWLEEGGKKKKKIALGDWIGVTLNPAYHQCMRCPTSPFHRGAPLQNQSHVSGPLFRFGWPAGRTSSAGLSVTAGQYHLHWHDPEGKMGFLTVFVKKNVESSKNEKKKNENKKKNK